VPTGVRGDDQKHDILISNSKSGIGFSIAQRFLETDSSLNIILGCRSTQNGKDAVAQLTKDGYPTVSFVELDITSDDSIAKAVKSVEEKYKKLDGAL
jgi:NAD(P)-dependent dehydrogenase (short-subunit alcohol dehydrogenase family)